MTTQTYAQWQEGLEKENSKWRTITVKDVMGKIGPMPYDGVEIDAVVDMRFTRDGVHGPIEVVDEDYKSYSVLFSTGEAQVSYLSPSVKSALQKYVDTEIMKYLESVPDYEWQVVENE